MTKSDRTSEGAPDDREPKRLHVEMGAPRPRPRWRRFWLVSFAVAPLAIILALRVWVIELYKIPGGSMTPTLHSMDYVMVMKLGAPARGQVSVFRFPENTDLVYAKRLVALPGETIEIADGRPIIDGKLVPHCHVGSYGQLGELYIESLGGHMYGVIHRSATDDRGCSTDRDCSNGRRCIAEKICAASVEGPWTVPDGEYWMLGDNRDNSHDSRRWHDGRGAGVPAALMIGHASSVAWNATEESRRRGSIGELPLLGPAEAELEPAMKKCAEELASR